MTIVIPLWSLIIIGFVVFTCSYIMSSHEWAKFPRHNDTIIIVCVVIGMLSVILIGVGILSYLPDIKFIK